MSRDRRSSRLSDPSSRGAPFWFHPSELFFLLLAVLIYLWPPEWPAMHFAESRLRGSLKAWVTQRTQRWSSWFGAHDRLAETRRQLERAAADLKLAEAELQTLTLQIHEIDALRSLFLLPKRTAYRYVYGEVVSHRVRPTESRLWVAVTFAPQGDGGIPRGAAVIAYGDNDWAAVGQVMERRDHQVEVMLLSDPRSKIGIASAASAALGSALINGAGMDRLVLDYVAHPHFMRALTPGTILVTAIESQFPAGLPVARIAEEGSAGDLAARLQPRPILPFGGLKYVVILVPSDAGEAGDSR